jgi:Kelch motif/Galactose oxidase, central domain
MRRFALAASLALVFAAPAAGGSAWRTHAPVPVPRTEVAAASVAGRIAVVGGYLADGTTTARADLYDPRTDSWTQLPDLPRAVNHAMAAAARGRLYVVGGYAPSSAPRAAFVFYGGRWRALRPLPAPRAAAGAAIVGHRLYVVGGIGPRGLAPNALVLDLRRNRWRFLRGPTPREHLAVTALGGRVYALAGRTAGLDTNLGRVESFAPGARRWRTLPSVPEPRGGTGATALRGRVVSVGGEAPDGTTASVYALDVAARRWRRLADLPTPRHGLGVVALAGRVYALAGGPQPGLTVSGANESLAVG